jgi:hypothetical protein
MFTLSKTFLSSSRSADRDERGTEHLLFLRLFTRFHIHNCCLSTCFWPIGILSHVCYIRTGLGAGRRVKKDNDGKRR